MSWLEFFSSAIGDLAWPVAAIFVAWKVAPHLGFIVPRIHKAGPTGVEFFPLDAQTVLEPEPQALQTSEPAPLIDPVASEIEARNLSNLKNIPKDRRETVLVRALTDQQLRGMFSLAYSDIFGSQIRLLEELNSRHLGWDDAERYFDDLRRRFPVFGSWSLETYIHYLLSWKLVQHDENGLSITETGRGFLRFLTDQQLTKERPN